MADATVASYSACVDLTTGTTLTEFVVSLDRATEDQADVQVSTMIAAGSKYVHHSDSMENASAISGLYAPWVSYMSLAKVFEAAMEAECSSEGWDDSLFTVTFSDATGKYTIANQTSGKGAFDITFNGIDVANFFGFTSVTPTSTSGSSYTSDAVASYCIIPSHDARSNFTAEYEPGNISSLAISDSGQVKKGIVRASVPLYMDWQQAFEPQVRVRTVDATSTAFFTWQQFWEHSRQTYPFIVNNTSLGNFEMHTLRDTNSNFNPEPVEVDNHEYHHLNFETHFIGRV